MPADPRTISPETTITLSDRQVRAALIEYTSRFLGVDEGAVSITELKRSRDGSGAVRVLLSIADGE